MADPNQPTHVTVTVYGARDLYSTNLIAKMDPYCIVTMGTHVFKTNVDDHGGRTPHWNQTFRMDYAGESHIRFKVMDKDKLTKDDYVGMADVTLSPIVFGTRVYNSEIELSRREGKRAGYLKVTIDMEPKKKNSTEQTSASTTSQGGGGGASTAPPVPCTPGATQPQAQPVLPPPPGSYPTGYAPPPTAYPGGAPPYYLPAGYVPTGYAAPAPGVYAAAAPPVVGYAAPPPVGAYAPPPPVAGYAPPPAATTAVYGAVPTAVAYPPAQAYGQPQPYYPPPAGGGGVPSPMPDTTVQFGGGVMSVEEVWLGP